MATIVEHKEKKRRYLLVRAGFGQFQSKWREGWGVGDLEKGNSQMICIADSEGEIGWAPSLKFKVLSVDGVTVESLKQYSDLAAFPK